MGEIKKTVVRFKRNDFKKEKVILLDLKGKKIIKYIIYYIIMFIFYNAIYGYLLNLSKTNIYSIIILSIAVEVILLNIIFVYILKNKILEKITRRFVEYLFVNTITLKTIQNLLYLHYNLILTYLCLFIYIVIILIIKFKFLEVLKMNLEISIK